MAISSSYDFTINRDELNKDALIEANVIEPTEAPSNDINAHATRTLNMMLKAFHADGLQLWLKRDATMFLEKDKTLYTLSNTGDHITEDTVVETAVKVAISTSDTSIDIDATASFTAGDYIGVEVDDGTVHWTTVASVTDSDTLVLTDAIDGAAAVDNVVYGYTNKIQQPLKLYDAFYSQWSSATQRYDRPMAIYSQEEYWSLSDKTAEGEPTNIMFMPQLNAAEVRLFQEPSDVKDYLKLILLFPMSDMDSATDNFEVPSYWYEAIKYNLAYRLIGTWGGPPDRRAELKRMAKETKDEAMAFDVENTSVFFQPDWRMRIHG